MLAEIRRVVSFDAYVWMLTDPETAVGAAPLADVPPAVLAQLPRLIGLKYLTAVNRWTSLPGKTARLTDPSRSRLWSELLHAHGITEVLLLSPTLDVEDQTSEVYDYLRVLVPPDADNPPIPASAYNVAAQLLANEEGIDDNPPWARVHLIDGRWLSLRAGRLGSTGQIAVTIEESSPAERLGVFSRAFGLSDRESELMTHLTSGADTRGLAGRMYLSENTVPDYFKSIFAKTATRSRGSLLSRALGGAAE